jgi:hypothetical protein
MTHDETQTFTKLLFDHKHLWVAFQETRHLKKFPDEDPYEVHCRFCDAADDLYKPLTDALLEGQPVEDPLETILLASNIAQSEGKVF